MFSIIRAFFEGLMHVSRTHCYRKDKALREQLDEKQIDKMIDDSFPASDPPSTY